MDREAVDRLAYLINLDAGDNCKFVAAAIREAAELQAHATYAGAALIAKTTFELSESGHRVSGDFGDPIALADAYIAAMRAKGESDAK